MTRVVAQPDYKVDVTFADGFRAVIELRPFLDKGIAAELLAPEVFGSVMVEDGGGIAWPNGFDVCPVFLRELAEKRQAAA